MPGAVRGAVPRGSNHSPSEERRDSVLWQAVVWSLLLCVFWQLTVGAADQKAQAPSSAYASMAAKLSSFPDYVKWPTAPSAPISVGILGDDSFGGALDHMNPKRSKRIDDLKDCQIIFIAKSEQENVDAILTSLGSANVLTVGESEGFAKQGGVIGFVTEGDKVRFEINIGAARRAGLGIDLRLLKLALHVFSS
jgi:hypothetical protein